MFLSRWAQKIKQHEEKNGKDEVYTKQRRDWNLCFDMDLILEASGFPEMIRTETTHDLFIQEMRDIKPEESDLFSGD